MFRYGSHFLWKKSQQQSSENGSLHSDTGDRFNIDGHLVYGATNCTNVRQDGGIVYTISNTPNRGTGDGVVHPSADPNSATHIQIEPDGRDGVSPPLYGYTRQSLIVVTTIPRGKMPVSVSELSLSSITSDDSFVTVAAD
uniref:Uncharacterized protein n=1 Tax=Anopheles culicifacies TaxID=139723 RepID=A0A182MVP3_9DIPT